MGRPSPTRLTATTGERDGVLVGGAARRYARTVRDEGDALPVSVDEVALRARALETVLGLARIAASATRAEELAQRAVAAVQAYTGAPGVCIFRYDEAGR